MTANPRAHNRHTDTGGDTDTGGAGGLRYPLIRVNPVRPPPEYARLRADAEGVR